MNEMTFSFSLFSVQLFMFAHNVISFMIVSLVLTRGVAIIVQNFNF